MSDMEQGRPRVLMVDDSRMVRATIIKRIRDRFDVREETDGEAGWEALLVDSTLRVVISDLSMPKLDGYGLLERIRASKIPRIRDIPVIMISGEEGEEARQRAKDLGATDFITKGIGTVELLSRLDAFVKFADTHEALVETRAQAAVDPATGLMTQAGLIAQGNQAVSYGHRHGAAVSAIVIRFDRFAELISEQGEAVGEMLLGQFAKILAGAKRKEDSLARWSTHEFAIISPGTAAPQACTFAERLRQGMERARIQHAGGPLTVTVSIGVVDSLEHAGQDAARLLEIASQRMLEAVAAGGNRVIDGVLSSTAITDSHAVDRALLRIAAGEGAALTPQLAQLGLRMLPLLRLIDAEYGLALPLDEIERRLKSAPGR